MHARCAQVALNGHNYAFKQVIRSPTLRGHTGTSVWDSAVVLAALVCNGERRGWSVRGLRCLELGSGVGVCGVVAVRTLYSLAEWW